MNSERFPSGRFELRACDLAGRMAYYIRFVKHDASRVLSNLVGYDSIKASIGWVIAVDLLVLG